MVQLFADTQSDSVAQFYTQRDNRDCWAQQDIWSSLEIESFRSLTDLEVLEVEFTAYSDDTKLTPFGDTTSIRLAFLIISPFG